MLPGKVTRIVNAGDVIRHEQAGAGGYGDPRERALAAIAADLRDGKITRGYAEVNHGAVFDATGDARRGRDDCAARAGMAGPAMTSTRSAKAAHRSR